MGGAKQSVCSPGLLAFIFPYIRAACAAHAASLRVRGDAWRDRPLDFKHFSIGICAISAATRRTFLLYSNGASIAASFLQACAATISISGDPCPVCFQDP